MTTTDQDIVRTARSIPELCQALTNAGWNGLGWMNGWRGEDPRHLPYGHKFVRERGTITIVGDYQWREYYLIDSSD